MPRQLKIIIFGFPHSGTSIIKSILGHCDAIYEYPYECEQISQELLRSHPTKHVLIKCPYLLPKFLTPKYATYIKLFILRDPHYVFSSLNRRFGATAIPRNHNIAAWQRTARTFLQTRKTKKIPNLFHLQYEDLFAHHFATLTHILDTLRIPYTSLIFNNTAYTNVITRDDAKTITHKPHPTDHNRFRTWQINQPLRNMNTPEKLQLTPAQTKKLASCQKVKLLGYTTPRAP